MNCKASETSMGTTIPKIKVGNLVLNSGTLKPCSPGLSLPWEVLIPVTMMSPLPLGTLFETPQSALPDRGSTLPPNQKAGMGIVTNSLPPNTSNQEFTSAIISIFISGPT